MRLRAGMQLSHYKILAPIGAGGMGEVYVPGTCGSIGDVAVKVLPEGLCGCAGGARPLRAGGQGACRRFTPQSRRHL